MTHRYYKVLVGGRSCHGGEQEWSLPDGETPGAWISVDGPLSMCSHGLHLTREPARWYKDGAVPYLAEYDGEVLDDDGDKICCRRVRLLSACKWVDLQVFDSGSHAIQHGFAYAYGSATVRASDSATVISTEYHSDSASVALSHKAAHVDRRNNTLALRSSPKPGQSPKLWQTATLGLNRLRLRRSEDRFVQCHECLGRQVRKNEVQL